MRFNSKEAAQDAFEIGGFIAQHTPRVISASLLLQNVTEMQPDAAPAGDGFTAKAWELPRKACLRTESGERGRILEPERKRARLDIPTIVVDSPSKTIGPSLSGDTPQHQIRSSSPCVTAPSQGMAYDSRTLAQPVRQSPESPSMSGVEEIAPPDTVVIEQPRKRRAPETLQHQAAMWTAPREQFPVLPPPRIQTAGGSAFISQGLGPAISEGPPYINGQSISSRDTNPSLRDVFSPFPNLAANTSSCMPSSSLDYRANSPLYEQPSLSDQISDWLEDPNTFFSQSDLTYLEVHSGTQSPLRLSAGALDKLQLIRMTLPISEQMDGLPDTSQRDWFLIEVWYKFDNARAARDHSQRSWVMAFPVSAITESYNAESKTIWTLEHESRVPAVHGRGISVSFLDEFMRSCALGKAILELGSLEPLF